MPDINMMSARPNPEDHEAAMARADLYKLANYSMKLFKMIHDGDNLEGWVQAKITKAADYIASVYHFMEYEMKFSEYGEKLETADMYTESVKQEYKRKLTEARAKLEKLKEKNIKDLDEGWEDMMKASKEREKEKGTGKFDKKSTSTGTVYTRKSSTFDDGGKDSDTKKAEKKSKKVKESGIFRAGMPVPQDIDGGSAPAPVKKPMAMAKPAPKVLDLEAAKRDPRYMKDPKFRKAVDDAEAFAKAFSSSPVREAAKPDFLDMDKDGNKKEPMKKAVADKKKAPFSKVKESSKPANLKQQAAIAIAKKKAK